MKLLAVALVTMLLLLALTELTAAAPIVQAQEEQLQDGSRAGDIVAFNARVKRAGCRRGECPRADRPSNSNSNLSGKEIAGVFNRQFHVA
jgi:hypothetical protein